jgi:hypothetical protein
VIFPGNTSAFLHILALGTSIPMVMGCFLVRPIPLPSDVPAGLERGRGALPSAVTSTSALIDDSRTQLLAHESDWELDESEEQSYSRALSRSSHGATSADDLLIHHSHGQTDSDLPNVFGVELWKSGDFWLLFTILSIRKSSLPSSELYFIVCLPSLVSCVPKLILVAGTGLMCEYCFDTQLGNCLVADIRPSFPTYRHQ